jgi:membrane-bound lytic murein transglycosylase F
MAWHGLFMIDIFYYLCARKFINRWKVGQEVGRNRSLTKFESLTRNLSVLLAIIGTMFLSCSRNPAEIIPDNSELFDLDSIRTRGRLIVITDYNSANYFLYKGEPMGFHYELLKAFSDHIGIDLEVFGSNSLEDSFAMLHKGQADLLAMGLTVTRSRGSELRFTETLDSTRIILVQKKPNRWRSLSADDLESRLVRDPQNLSNKTVYVQKGSSHAEYLNALPDIIVKKLTVIEVPFEAEALIDLVSRGEIEYAVCDENIAVINAARFPDIDIGTRLSTHQNIAWAIRETNSDQLADELDNWIRSFRETHTFAILYSKYFRNSNSVKFFQSDYYTLNSGKVSQWDNLIKTYSATIGWDWRLLASLIYQESRFIPDVMSKVGAYGLMQVLPETGRYFGIDVTASPELNIKAGVKFIAWLHDIFDSKISDEAERKKFILAAYNAGPGHILDAMKLAEKNGMDPQVWEGSVALWVLKKSDPVYYKDSVVKHGYFKGTESVAFVSQILERYRHYRNILPANGESLTYNTGRASVQK